jgi:hypothetical protein
MQFLLLNTYWLCFALYFAVHGMDVQQAVVITQHMSDTCDGLDDAL